MSSGRAAAALLLNSHPDIDALVCVNDMLAVGALQEVRARGRRVPEDVQLIGFDDQPLMDVIGLSTIRQPMDEFGGWAARSIAALLGRGAGAGKPSTVTSLQLPIELVARATSRAPLTGAKRRP